MNGSIFCTASRIVTDTPQSANGADCVSRSDGAKNTPSTVDFIQGALDSSARRNGWMSPTATEYTRGASVPEVAGSEIAGTLGADAVPRSPWRSAYVAIHARCVSAL